MIKTVFAVTLAAFLTFSAPTSAQFTYVPTSRDDVGLYLGSQIWQSGSSGVLGSEHTRVDFNLKKQQQINYFIDVKHPIAALPHLRISTTQLGTSGQTTLAQEFGFSDKTFPVAATVETSFHVSYIDYTLYYALFDSKDFSLELGFTARDLNGNVTVAGTTKSSDDTCNDPNPSPDSPCTDTGNNAISSGTIKTDDINPMLFVATSVGLPSTPLNLFARADVSLLNDHRLTDYQLGFSYDLHKLMRVDLQVTLGYRVVNLAFDNLNSLYTDLAFKGAFVGMIAHF